MLRLGIIQQYVHNKFERDLAYIKIALKKDDKFATDVYRALCNMRWRMKWTPFKYSCSWRYAGGLIADIREQGEDYIDFYCSGKEGIVTDKVKNIFNQLGWIPSPWPQNPRSNIFNKLKIFKNRLNFNKIKRG